MKWFKHDASANRDDKLGKVLLKYGSDGYALYWLCLELIADRLDGENASFELKHDAELLGAILKIDTLRVEEIMKYFISLKLFESDSGAITCYKLGLRLDPKSIRNPQIIAIIKGIDDKKRGQARTCADNLRQIRLDYIRIDNTKSDKSPEKITKDSKGISKDAKWLATLLYDLHFDIDSGFKATDRQLDQWGDAIDKINRLDGRSWDQIEEVIRWAKADSFWKSNIISGKKLREKFAILVAKMPKREYICSELKEVIAPDEFGEMMERSHDEN